MSPDNPIVMYLVVRESLNMSPGKTAAQVGHAVQYLCEMIASPVFESYKSVIFDAWNNSWHRKVVLKADEKEWEKLKADVLLSDRVIVVDQGLTELNPNTETVMGFLPMLKSNCPKLIKRLQVLK